MTRALRRQLPVYSPLSLQAVRAAMKGALGDPAGLRSAIIASLCSTYGARDGLLVGSGTTALRLALAGVRATVSRQPVALPAYSCYDVATAAEGADVDVLLYDVEPTTLGPDEASLRSALEREPAAVVAAHLYGYPVDMRRIAQRSRESGAVVIEDAAQGAGGRLDGARLGSFGSVTVLSFGRGKGTTAGAGGALLAHDDIGAKILSWAAGQVPSPSGGLREAALLAAQWALGRPGMYWLPASLPFLHLGETLYHPPSPPSAMSAAAVRALDVSLRGGEAEVERRRSLALRLAERARSSGKVHVVEPIEGAAPGYLRLPLLVKGPARADALERLARYGVASGYPTPLTSLPAFMRRVKNSADELAGASALARQLVTFPTHGLIGAADADALESWLDRSSGMGVPKSATSATAPRR